MLASGGADLDHRNAGAHGLQCLFAHIATLIDLDNHRIGV